VPAGLVLPAARAGLNGAVRNASDSRLICAITEGAPAKTMGPVDGMRRLHFHGDGRLWLGRASGLPGSLVLAVAAHELGDVGSVDAMAGAAALDAAALAARADPGGGGRA
jgi:hypothetical protein